MSVKSSWGLFLSFLQSSERIFLYGIGEFGKSYSQLLQKLHTPIDGAIVTNAVDKSDFFGVPIYSREEIVPELLECDGVIGAFDGATEEELTGLLYGHRNVFVLDREEFFFQLNKLFVLPKLTTIIASYDKNICGETTNLFERILIIRLDVLGDIIMTTPFIREFRKNYPNACIHLVVRSSNFDLMDRCPYVDKVIPYDVVKCAGYLQGQLRKIDDIKSNINEFIDSKKIYNEYSLVVLPRELMAGRSCLEEFLLAISVNSQHMAGRIRSIDSNQMLFLENYQKTFDLLDIQNTLVHESEAMLDLLEYMGGRIQEKKQEVWFDDRDKIKVSKLIPKGDNETFIALGIRSQDDVRSWPIEYYSQLINKWKNLSTDKINFLVFGDKSVQKYADILIQDNVEIVNLVGKTTLPECVVAMKMCKLYIGGNTGLMHLAAACGVPCVVINATLPDVDPHDGNSPQRMGAYGVKFENIHPLVGLDGCTSTCKKQYAHCIRQVSVQEVLNISLTMLDSKRE